MKGQDRGGRDIRVDPQVFVGDRRWDKICVDNRGGPTLSYTGDK